jgi:hypothetical protein
VQSLLYTILDHEPASTDHQGISSLVSCAGQHSESVRVTQGRPFEFSATLGSVTFQIAAIALAVREQSLFGVPADLTNARA